MNLLLVREFLPDIEMPDFGKAFLRHMESKTNLSVRTASLNAWALLAEGLNRLGLPLYEAEFEETGKPRFRNSGLCFSLSHSGRCAAVLIADSPCGVDIEEIREIKENLVQRCMHPEELASDMDFFEAWTKKECLAKLDGSGMRSHPNAINTLEYAGWLTRRFSSSINMQYHLSAICESREAMEPVFLHKNSGL